jgi:hypothetical protein
LFKRYKLVCVHNDLSLPKQTAQLIRTFVEVQEMNIRNTEKFRDISG